jgi:hypothetical protein
MIRAVSIDPGHGRRFEAGMLNGPKPVTARASNLA